MYVQDTAHSAQQLVTVRWSVEMMVVLVLFLWCGVAMIPEHVDYHCTPFACAIPVWPQTVPAPVCQRIALKCACPVLVCSMLW